MTTLNAGTLQAGVTLDKYQIIRKLGQGGMGHVYLARDTQLNYPEVVLKILDNSDSHPQRAKRFAREAKIVQKLRHPNVIRVYEVGEAEGLSYIAMEYVDGQPLDLVLEKARAAGHPVEISYTVDIITQIATGLMYAYDNYKIIHRDIKPANILINKNNHARLTDFGIARALEEASDLTSDTPYIGTPLYMSPEHAGSGPIDHRSDVYSLGVVLHEMLTGNGPFGRNLSTVELINKHRTEPPQRVIPYNEHVNPILEQVALKALAKKPEDRFQTADEMARALGRAYEGLPINTSMPTQISNEPPVAPRDLRILLPLAGLIIAAFLMIAAGVIGLFPWQSTNPTPPPTPPAATTAASPLASPTPVLITLKQEVHLYNLPELGTPQKGRIPPGAQLTLLARDPGNAWVKVVTQDNENGWVQAAELPLSSEVAAQLPLGVLPVTTPLTVIPISSPAPAVTISPTQPPLTPTATVKPVVETTVELTEEATEEATAMPLDSTTEPPPPVRQPCQVEIVGPPQDAAFITADEIRLEWSSPGRLAYNQTYRVSFYRPGDRQYLNAFLTKDPFAVKAAGNTHWINPNNQEWVANVQENAAYEWEVAVLENEEQELCKSDSRIFVWNLK